MGLTKLEIDAQCLLRAQAMPGQEDEVKNTENKWRNKYLIEQTACVWKLFPISCALSFLIYDIFNFAFSNQLNKNKTHKNSAKGDGWFSGM